MLVALIGIGTRSSMQFFEGEESAAVETEARAKSLNTLGEKIMMDGD